MQDECLKIPCKWEDNRLILKEKYKDISAGAEIISVEGMGMEHIFAWEEKKIPHENIYLVKSRMIEYPYTIRSNSKNSIRWEYFTGGTIMLRKDKKEAKRLENSS